MLHRKDQDKLRRQFGPAYCSDLGLIFANPDGTLLKPDLISASIIAPPPALRSANGCQPRYAAPHPWVGFASGRRGPCNRIGTPGALLGSRDSGHLLARASR